MTKTRTDWNKVAALAADATLAYLSSQSTPERRTDFYVRSAHIRSNDKAYRFIKMLVDEGYDMAAPFVTEIASCIQIALLDFPGIKQAAPSEAALLSFILQRRWQGRTGVAACSAEWVDLQRERRAARGPTRRTA